MMGGEIHRTFDPTTHNRIANLEGVRNTYGILLPSNTVYDFSELAKRPDDFILLTNFTNAASILEIKTPAVYEVHTLFDPACRLRDKIRLAKVMLDWMWAYTKAQSIYGTTPVELTGARWFNRQVGFISDGEMTRTNRYGTHTFECFHILRP